MKNYKDKITSENYKDSHRNKSQNYFFGCSLSYVMRWTLPNKASINLRGQVR
jgi:hypothetical protein